MEQTSQKILICPKERSHFFVIFSYGAYKVERYYLPDWQDRIIGFISIIEMGSIVNNDYTLIDYIARMKKYTPQEIAERIEFI